MGRVRENIARMALTKKIPLSVHFDLTNRCNELCIHCYRVVEAARPELTTDEVRAILDQLAEAGTLYLTFSGGDVLLRRDLFDILGHAKHRRFDVRLKTNGLLLTDQIAGRLHDLGIAQVDISLYSADPTAHDAVTGIESSFERTLSAAVLLKTAGIRVLLTCPLMQQTAEGFDAILRLAQEKGLTIAFDPTISPKNNGDRLPISLRLSAMQYRKLLQHPYFQPDPSASTEICLPQDAEGTDSLSNLLCGASHAGCYISPYGDVYPCVQMPIPCGNLRDRNFLEIWHHSPQMLQVRNVSLTDLRTCKTCSLAADCTRCPGMAYLESGSLTGPSAPDCQKAAVVASYSQPWATMEVRDEPAFRFFRTPSQPVGEETVSAPRLGG